MQLKICDAEKWVQRKRKSMMRNVSTEHVLPSGRGNLTKHALRSVPYNMQIASIEANMPIEDQGGKSDRCSWDTAMCSNHCGGNSLVSFPTHMFF
jgi:hypothetical protein